MNINLIAPFDQSDVMASRVGTSAAATAGACHNFTIEWLSKMFAQYTRGNHLYANADAALRMQALRTNSGGANPVLQKAFGNHWTSGDMRKADDLSICLRGLKKEALLLDYYQFDPASLVAHVQHAACEGMIYSFFFADGSGHTIGFFRKTTGEGRRLAMSTPYLICFDPNFGEYQIPDVGFNNWFTIYQTFYPAITYDMLRGVSKQ